jgi:hypothetical protein
VLLCIALYDVTLPSSGGDVNYNNCTCNTFLFVAQGGMTQTTSPISMRFEVGWLAALDAWRAAQPVPPSRAAAFRAGVDMLMRTHSAPLTAQEPSAVPKRREKLSPVSEADIPPGKRRCSKCGEIYPRIDAHTCNGAK